MVHELLISGALALWPPAVVGAGLGGYLGVRGFFAWWALCWLALLSFGQCILWMFRNLKPYGGLVHQVRPTDWPPPFLPSAPPPPPPAAPRRAALRSVRCRGRHPRLSYFVEPYVLRPRNPRQGFFVLNIVSSGALYPLELMPPFFRIGYGLPFWNAVRRSPSPFRPLSFSRDGPAPAPSLAPDARPEARRRRRRAQVHASRYVVFGSGTAASAGGSIAVLAAWCGPGPPPPPHRGRAQRRRRAAGLLWPSGCRLAAGCWSCT